MPPIIQSAGELVATGSATDALTRAGLPSASLALYAGRVSSYAAIVRTQPNVRTVVSFIARNLAQLGVHLFDRLSDTDRRRLTDHPFTDALAVPNPQDRRMTRYRLIHATVWDVCAYDVGFWALVGSDLASRPAIVRLDPRRLTIHGRLWPEAYEYRGPRGSVTFTPDQIVHFQGSLGMDDPLWGNPPIEALRRVLAEEAAQGEYREAFWTRGARHSGTLSRPVEAPDWSDAARKRFLSEFAANYQGNGPKAGGVPLLEDGMTFTETNGADARSAQYVESRKLTREEVAAAFHIDPIWVGISGTGEAFASVKERHRALYMDDLGPWAVMLEEDFTRQALPAFEPDPARLATLYVRLNLAEKLRGSIEDQAEAISRLVGRPVLTANEGRALLDRNALDEGDGLVLPLNVVVGGQTVPGLAPFGGPTDGEAAALPAGAKAGRKAVGLTPALVAAIRAEHEAGHTRTVSRTFERQGAEILSELGATGAVTFDRDRWDGELAADLFAAGLTLAEAVALLQADALGLDPADVDTETLEPFLATSARVAAENINAVTDQALRDAVSGLAGDDALDATRHLFEVAAASRAAQIATTRVTAVTAFTGADVARQAGRTLKVWNVVSSKSRHPYLDGEAVPLFDLFSNGGEYPGGPSLSVDETAGCTCYLTFQ